MKKGTKRQRRPARSAEEWTGIIEDWRGSGLTAEEYGQGHDMTAASLWRWSHRMPKKRAPKTPREQGCRVPRFIAVDLGRQEQARSAEVDVGEIELELGRGHVVRLRGRMSREALAAVFGAAFEVSSC